MKKIKISEMRLKNKLIKIISLGATLVLPFGLISTNIFAAGLTNVTATLSPVTVSTLTTMTLAFTPATGLATGSKILVSWTGSTFTGGASLTNADITVTKTGDANYTSKTASAFTATGFTITLTTGGTLNTSSAFSITIGGTNKLTNPATAQNVQVNVSTTTSADVQVDQGAGVASVGNANQVQITATVNQTLSFDIRTAADAAQASFPATCGNTNGGGAGANNGLGTLSTSSTNYCQYRLKVATNATSGFTVSYVASGAITNGTTTLANPSGTTTETTAGSITTGTEAYGANVQPGAVTVGGATVASGKTCATNCTTTGNTYRFDNTSTPVSVYTSNKGNNPSGTDTTNTALVTHLATVGATTPAGLYTQTVTYSIVASF